jgi:outer membrane protein assembly factor BamB
MFGVSVSGRLLWTHDTPAPILDWVRSGDRLIFSTTGEDASAWEVDETGLSVWVMPKSGQLIAHDDQFVVHSEDGVYRLGADRSSANLLYALPKGRLEQGDLVALADGGLLLIHADFFDRRLIVLNGDGRLRWQRSVARSLRGTEYHVLVVDGHPFIASHGRFASASELSVFGIDRNHGVLVRLFAVRGWTPRPRESWAYAIGDDRILLNIGSGTGSGRLVALNTRKALESLTQAMTAE